MSITYEQLLNDFKVYLRVKWKWLGLPPPTLLQEELADFLQFGGSRLLIKGFRGVAKSWITAAYIEWRWLRCRDLRVLVVSGNQRKADEISLFIKQSIDGFPPLEPLRWQDWEKADVRWGIQQFNVRGAPPDIAPSCKAASIGSMLVGSRAHLIIGDDVETPNNSSSVDARDTLLGQVGEFESILLPGGEVKLLGTPQSEESIYGTIETRGYNTRVWPVRVPTEQELPLYRGCLSPMILEMYTQGKHGDPVEPLRFPEEVLLQKEAGMTSAAWRLQMMLDTTLADREKHPLKLNDLLVTPLDAKQAPMTIVWSSVDKHRVTDIPQMGFTGDYLVRPQFIGEQWMPYDQKLLVVDPSGRGDNETTWTVLCTLSGKYFVLDFGGSTDGYGPETLSVLLDKAREYGLQELIYEDNYGDGMFGEILKQHFKTAYPMKITGVRSSGRKEHRIIDTLEPVLRSHKLVVDHGALLRDSRRDNSGYSLQYQLTRITRERGAIRWDDAIDCLSIGIGHLVRAAGVNSEESLENLKRRQMEEHIENLLKVTQVFREENISLTLDKKATEFLRGNPRHFWNKRRP